MPADRSRIVVGAVVLAVLGLGAYFVVNAGKGAIAAGQGDCVKVVSAADAKTELVDCGGGVGGRTGQGLPDLFHVEVHQINVYTWSYATQAGELRIVQDFWLSGRVLEQDANADPLLVFRIRLHI